MIPKNKINIVKLSEDRQYHMNDLVCTIPWFSLGMSYLS